MQALLLSLFVFLGRTAVLSEKKEVCEALLIHKCSGRSRGLLKVLESGNKSLSNKDCDALQATIDCLSVPRCPGNLLTTFRYYVLLTALSLSKASDTCPRLDVETLQSYVIVIFRYGVQSSRECCLSRELLRCFRQGSKYVSSRLGCPRRSDSSISIPCKDSESINDQCQRKCQCRDGDLVSCCRVRKEFTTMSLTERRRFIEVLKLAATSPRYRSDYDTLTTLHSRVPSKFLHHMPQIFLPWHRWYLLQFENFLRQIDCRVTIPYWNWSRVSEHWTRGSVWSPAPHGLGGNGILPERCVMDGQFRKSEFRLPWSVGGGCLKRDFNFSCNLPNLEDTRDLVMLENFTTFEQAIREQFHTKFHNCVGGNMAHHATASFTPEFWLLHGFIDKLWTAWQSKSLANQFQYYTDIRFTMPGSDKFPWEFLDQDSLPGGIRILYE